MGIYPVKKTLDGFKLDMNYCCSLCKLYIESIYHLFYQCIYVRIFWNDVQHYIGQKTGQIIQLKKDILVHFK